MQFNIRYRRSSDYQTLLSSSDKDIVNTFSYSNRYNVISRLLIKDESYLTLKGAQGGTMYPPSTNWTISGIDLVKISKLVTDNSDIGPVGYSGQTPCAKNQPLIFYCLWKIMV